MVNKGASKEAALLHDSPSSPNICRHRPRLGKHRQPRCTRVYRWMSWGPPLRERLEGNLDKAPKVCGIAGRRGRSELRPDMGPQGSAFRRQIGVPPARKAARADLGGSRARSGRCRPGRAWDPTTGFLTNFGAGRPMVEFRPADLPNGPRSPLRAGHVRPLGRPVLKRPGIDPRTHPILCVASKLSPMCQNPERFGRNRETICQRNRS